MCCRTERQVSIHKAWEVFFLVPYHHVGTLGFFPFGLLGALTGLLFLVGFVLLIIWLVRMMVGTQGMRWNAAAPPAAPPSAPPSAPPVESPLDILARRFASGAITSEEYQKARDVLAEAPKP